MSALTPDKALIFRITHIDNVAWILRNGLHCRNSSTSAPNYVEIGNLDLIAMRTQRDVPLPPGGTLSDYIPFYFTPYSPMLLNIKTGYNGVTRRPMEDIAILVSSLHDVQRLGIDFVFTDRHAYLQTAEFYNELDNLDHIDWAILQARDFRRNPEDPGKFERYQAEALIHRSLPISALSGIICYGDEQQKRIQGDCDNFGADVKVLNMPGWYL
jgi:hypothetical protein